MVVRCEGHVCSSMHFSRGETGTCQHCNKLIHLYCTTSFQFPSQLVFYNFVRLYYTTTTKTDWSTNVLPAHICYDAKRCNAYSSTIKIDQYDCSEYNEFQWVQNIHSI
ncbi:unnamed protein product [Didymodactylos carnosus]|uniref:Uncharacterized protein n=1 Tax=Didymodactylos carnosus TaxID=1234261 RepID=A0A814GR69_9BILA|nr:unnamed protein product [Didymodactylos carnosus]CAF3771588.1 unnamed protein product [Didymodactylos carnosus]